MKMLKRVKILMAVLLPPIFIMLVGCCCLLYSMLPPELKPIMAIMGCVMLMVIPSLIFFYIID